MNTEWESRDLEAGDEELEEALRSELRRVEAPEGFTERMLARVAVEGSPRGRVLRWRGRQAWTGWAVAAGLLGGVLAGGSAWEHHAASQRRAAEATAQFETAERITDQAMEQVRQEMARAGVDPKGL